MKAKEIDIEIMIQEEERMEVLTFKNMTVKTAINKVLRQYPTALIFKLESNFFN